MISYKRLRLTDNLGKNIRIMCAYRGMSIRELADRTGLSPSSIYNITSGGHVPSFSTVIRIADGLNCSLDEIAGRDNG